MKTTALSLLTLVLSGSVFAQAPPRIVPSELEPPIITWTNMARVQLGKPPLRISDELNRAARIQARQMAASDVMAHTIDGDTLADRVRRVGYRHAGVGENIAYVFGHQYPAWVMFDGWMRSEGHYRNIMNDQFTEIGVAVARSDTGKLYACQVFGRPASAPAYQTMPSPYVGMPMPYRPHTPVAPYYCPYGGPSCPSKQAAPVLPYSPYTGAPQWLRTTSQTRPVDDMIWHAPWWEWEQ